MSGDDGQGPAPNGERFFLTRGVVLRPGDITTLDWPRRAKAAGLTTLATHGSRRRELDAVGDLLHSDEGHRFLESCRDLGLHVEHEMHAMADLLPPTLFEKDPTMFRMNDQGDRVPDSNLCVHSARALEVVCENAVAYARKLRPTTGRYFYWGDDGKPMCRCPHCRGLWESDQMLLAENAMLAALRRVEPDATLAHLAYHGTFAAPTQVEPAPGIFLEYAPIRRRYDVPFGRRDVRCDTRTHGDMLDALDANLEVFGHDGAQALEYWLDVSRFSHWQRGNKAALAWHPDVFREDLEAYASRGIRHVTSFACWLDGDYVARFGEPPLDDYGSAMLAWSLEGGPRRRA